MKEINSNSDVIWFGKHQGKTVETVLADDPGYFLWMEQALAHVKVSSEIMSKARENGGELRPGKGKETPKTEGKKPTVATTADLGAMEALAGAILALGEGKFISLIKEHAPKPVFPLHKIELKVGDVVKKLEEKPRHKLFESLLKAVSAGVNVFVVGPAGSGKTTTAQQIAEALELPFYFTGAIDSPYKLTGFIDAQGRIVNSSFRKAYVEGGLFLFDEIDGSLPGAILAFNAALANEMADFPDKSEKKHPNFRVIAAANTYGLGADRMYVGRNQLDAASLDRFAFIEFPYDETLERLLTSNDGWVDRVQAVRKAVNKLKMRHIISPRASLQGAALLGAGLPQKTVEEMCIWRGLKPEDVSKLKSSL